MKFSIENFFKRLRFKYQVIVLNEKTLEEAFHAHISQLTIITSVSLFAIISFALFSLLIFITPLKHMLPGFADVAVKGTVINTSLRADSINTQLEYNNQQILLIKNIIMGNLPNDSTLSPDSVSLDAWSDISVGISENEMSYIAAYEDENLYNVSSSNNENKNPDALIFAQPVRGTVTSSYAPNINEFGISLLCSPNSAVLAVQEGNIILTDFNTKTGYSVIIQHTRGYISIYHNIGRLLRKIGDKVVAGEAIGIVGDPNQEDSNPHIGFELWYNGSAINPEEYIIF